MKKKYFVMYEHTFGAYQKATAVARVYDSLEECLSFIGKMNFYFVVEGYVVE
ncbi:MAG: hypothetical protein WC444_07140 [Candidatus Paceibacterota bacterium]